LTTEVLKSLKIGQSLLQTLL